MHKPDPDDRAAILARYIIENGATVRKAAAVYGVSKSTVHKDVTSRLKEIDAALYAKVKEVLEKNKAQRHIRGGMATKQKYLEINQVKASAAAKKKQF